MSNVENIDDHSAKFYECGSVNFNLLKSGQIECSCCGKRFGAWQESRSIIDDFERECKDTDELLRYIGWTSEQCRTEGGSLRLAELKDALDSRLALGSGG